MSECNCGMAICKEAAALRAEASRLEGELIAVLDRKANVGLALEDVRCRLAAMTASRDALIGVLSVIAGSECVDNYDACPSCLALDAIDEHSQTEYEGEDDDAN